MKRKAEITDQAPKRPICAFDALGETTAVNVEEIMITTRALLDDILSFLDAENGTKEEKGNNDKATKECPENEKSMPPNKTEDAANEVNLVAKNQDAGCFEEEVGMESKFEKSNTDSDSEQETDSSLTDSDSCSSCSSDECSICEELKRAVFSKGVESIIDEQNPEDSFHEAFNELKSKVQVRGDSEHGALNELERGNQLQDNTEHEASDLIETEYHNLEDSVFEGDDKSEIDDQESSVDEASVESEEEEQNHENMRFKEANAMETGENGQEDSMNEATCESEGDEYTRQDSEYEAEDAMETDEENPKVEAVHEPKIVEQDMEVSDQEEADDSKKEKQHKEKYELQTGDESPTEVQNQVLPDIGAGGASKGQELSLEHSVNNKFVEENQEEAEPEVANQSETDDVNQEVSNHKARHQMETENNNDSGHEAIEMEKEKNQDHSDREDSDDLEVEEHENSDHGFLNKSEKKVVQTPGSETMAEKETEIDIAGIAFGQDPFYQTLYKAHEDMQLLQEAVEKTPHQNNKSNPCLYKEASFPTAVNQAQNDETSLTQVYEQLQIELNVNRSTHNEPHLATANAPNAQTNTNSEAELQTETNNTTGLQSIQLYQTTCSQVTESQTQDIEHEAQIKDSGNISFPQPFDIIQNQTNPLASITDPVILSATTKNQVDAETTGLDQAILNSQDHSTFPCTPGSYSDNSFRSVYSYSQTENEKQLNFYHQEENPSHASQSDNADHLDSNLEMENSANIPSLQALSENQLDANIQNPSLAPGTSQLAAGNHLDSNLKTSYQTPSLSAQTTNGIQLDTELRSTDQAIVPFYTTTAGNAGQDSYPSIVHPPSHSTPDAYDVATWYPPNYSTLNGLSTNSESRGNASVHSIPQETRFHSPAAFVPVNNFQNFWQFQATNQLPYSRYNRALQGTQNSTLQQGCPQIEHNFYRQPYYSNITEQAYPEFNATSSGRYNYLRIAQRQFDQQQTHFFTNYQNKQTFSQNKIPSTDWFSQQSQNSRQDQNYQQTPNYYYRSNNSFPQNLLPSNDHTMTSTLAYLRTDTETINREPMNPSPQTTHQRTVSVAPESPTLLSVQQRNNAASQSAVETNNSLDIGQQSLSQGNRSQTTKENLTFSVSEGSRMLSLIIAKCLAKDSEGNDVNDKPVTNWDPSFSYSSEIDIIATRRETDIDHEVPNVTTQSVVIPTANLECLPFSTNSVTDSAEPYETDFDDNGILRPTCTTTSNRSFWFVYMSGTNYIGNDRFEERKVARQYEENYGNVRRLRIGNNKTQKVVFIDFDHSVRATKPIELMHELNLIPVGGKIDKVLYPANPDHWEELIWSMSNQNFDPVLFKYVQEKKDAFDYKPLSRIMNRFPNQSTKFYKEMWEQEENPKMKPLMFEMRVNHLRNEAEKQKPTSSRFANVMSRIKPYQPHTCEKDFLYLRFLYEKINSFGSCFFYDAVEDPDKRKKYFTKEETRMLILLMMVVFQEADRLRLGNGSTDELAQLYVYGDFSAGKTMLFRRLFFATDRYCVVDKMRKNPPNDKRVIIVDDEHTNFLFDPKIRGHVLNAMTGDDSNFLVQDTTLCPERLRWFIVLTNDNFVEKLDRGLALEKEHQAKRSKNNNTGAGNKPRIRGQAKCNLGPYLRRNIVLELLANCLASSGYFFNSKSSDRLTWELIKFSFTPIWKEFEDKFWTHSAIGHYFNIFSHIREETIKGLEDAGVTVVVLPPGFHS
jgi:hypothetical protein